MVEIRRVQPSELRETEEITREAFWNRFQPGSDEHFILHEVRKHSDYVPELDLVAVVDGKLVGSIVYSKASIVTADGRTITDVVAFGPVSVLPDQRKKGIGAELVMQSMRLAKEMGMRAVIIYGDPRFYGRLGFRCGERYDLTNGEGEFCIGMMAYPLFDGALDGMGGILKQSAVFESISPEAVAEFDKDFIPKEKGHSDFQAEFGVLMSLHYARGEKYTL